MKGKDIYILLSIMAFFSCKKDAVPQPTPYPSLILNSVSNSPKGINFSVNILSLGNDPILDYGFVWCDSSSVPKLSDYRYSMGKSLHQGRFEYQITLNFGNNITYNTRAYIKTYRYLVYSNQLSFVSHGSLPVQVDSVTPNLGFDSSTIILKGKYFSKGNFNVFKIK
jgi:hypothetical protein